MGAEPAFFKMVVFRNLCHFSKMYKTGMTHEHRFRFRPSY